MLYKKIFKDITTGIDNKTYDAGRVYLLIAMLVFCFSTVYSIYMQVQFDFQSFGIGFGALMTGAGLGIKLKENTEPQE